MPQISQKCPHNLITWELIPALNIDLTLSEENSVKSKRKKEGKQIDEYAVRRKGKIYSLKRNVTYDIQQGN